MRWLAWPFLASTVCCAKPAETVESGSRTPFEVTEPVAAGEHDLSALGYPELAPEESATVTGRVYDSDGRPLADFVVRALLVHPAPYYGTCGEKELRSSRDGSFELERLRPGQLFVEVVAPGYAASRSSLFPAAAGTTVRDVVVWMSAGGSLTGRIVDGRTGSAASGADVHAFDPYDSFDEPRSAGTRTETDAQGRFTLEHLRAGSWSLQVGRNDCATLIVEDLVVEEGKTTELEPLRLTGGATVEGAVLGAGGAFIANAAVQLSRVEGGSFNRSTRADMAGRFRIEHVASGSYHLSATRPEHSSSDPFEVIRDIRDSEIEVVVREGELRSFELHLHLD